ncbi:MAG: YihA family ribosome biogenesis GTP-binding protein [Paludibacteraceae bacterium]|nr:YihA family ribosome biogenesis GTP-binding protein [Paludibacteraceae bacterium]
MQINSAVFLKSCARQADLPKSSLPEYAFIGRSNVGKSSLINMLTGVKGLAQTSAKPGKTLLVNYFTVNDTWYLVDLPGYGYARVGKNERARLEQRIKGYILEREQLTNLFVLIDSRLDPQRIDLEFIQWLGENGVPFSLVFTKADKLSKRALESNMEAYRNTLLQTWESLPPIFYSSSETGLGRQDLLDYIGQINQSV